MKTFAWCIVSAGLALMVAFAAVRFEAGVVVDAAGGVGTLPPVQAAIGIGGVILVFAGIVALALTARRSHARASVQPSPLGG